MDELKKAQTTRLGIVATLLGQRHRAVIRTLQTNRTAQFPNLVVTLGII